MIDHIDVCLCICKITLLRNSLKFTMNVIQIDSYHLLLKFILTFIF